MATPREGIHALRVPFLDVAAVDLAGTALLAWALSARTRASFWAVFAGLMVLAVVVHWWLGVRTRLNAALGL